MSLLVIVPTRGRPERFRAFLDAWDATTDGTARLLACVDYDDDSAVAYPPLPSWGEYTVGPRNGFAPRLNAEAMTLCEEFDIIASFGDDHLPRTPGWDGKIAAALRDLGSGIVYPNDLLQYEGLPTAPAITTDIVRALGFYCPPGFAHVYVDNFWLGLGIRLERLRYLPDVIVEHRHPQAHKAEWDATYEEGQTNAIQVADWERWNAYRSGGEFTADIERVRAAIR